MGRPLTPARTNAEAGRRLTPIKVEETMIKALRRPWGARLAMVMCLALVVAACGDSSTSSTTATAPDATTTTQGQQESSTTAEPEATGFMGCPAVENDGLVEVHLLLDWLPLGRFAPFYYALEEGIYEEAGFDVTITHAGPGSAAAAQQLASGNADWMTNPLSSMLTVMGQTTDPMMRSYAVLYAKAAQAIFFFEGGPISEPKDLEGQTIATSAGANEFRLFPLFAEANGVNPDLVNWEVVDGSAKIGLLLNHSVPATSTNILSITTMQANAAEGETIGTFVYGDWGVEQYGASLITTDDWRDNNPGMVCPFVQASLAGYANAFENPEAAIDAMIIHHPDLGEDREAAIAEIAIIEDLMITDYQKEHGLGAQDPAMVESTYDQTVDLTGQEIALPFDEFFSNEAINP